MQVSAEGTELDHIVIVAPTLAAGAAYVQRVLGVSPQAGGAHARMATHNLLLRLGEATYLEVIAVDPSAAPPGRPRWFGMDARDPSASPALVTWVARSKALDAVLSRCLHAAGEALPMSRGDLRWRITVPADGSLPEGGLLPTLIEWHTPVHPASMLEDGGVRLEKLLLRHPDPPRCKAFLRAMGFSGSIEVVDAAPGTSRGIEAQFSTPLGVRVVSGP